MAVQAKPEHTFCAPALKPAVPLTVTPLPKPTPTVLLAVTWSPYAKAPYPLATTWLPPAKVKSSMLASSQLVWAVGTRPKRTEPRSGTHMKRVPAPEMDAGMGHGL